MHSEPVVSVRDLTVRFSRWGQQVTALDRLSLTIPHGQWVLLVGPNGSGKSTLLSALAGTVPAASGQVRVNGWDVGVAVQQRAWRYLFRVHQNPLEGTAPGLTVEENLRVAEPPPAGRDNKTSRRNRFIEWLSPLGLQDRLRQPVESLSGGERQLLALLIGRLRSARLLLLDEPLAAMDPARAALGLRQIADLHRDGRTVVQVSHDPSLIENFEGRLVQLEAGRVVFDSLATP